tara:strand:- start:329 stop:613 length:285 start_codon:yes stop_codon:yes gene_type:complete
MNFEAPDFSNSVRKIRNAHVAAIVLFIGYAEFSRVLRRKTVHSDFDHRQHGIVTESAPCHRIRHWNPDVGLAGIREFIGGGDISCCRNLFGLDD